MEKIHIDGSYPPEKIPFPASGDIAETGIFRISTGAEDSRSGGFSVLNNGRIAFEKFAPDDNFFFQGPEGGRLLLDLQRPARITQINTYADNLFNRGAQVYAVYTSDGKSAGFVQRPPRRMDPARVGWQHLADVDTRQLANEVAGLCGASIADSEGALGTFRYLLFDVAVSETSDSFGNAFFSEIDVVDAADNTRPAQVGWADQAGQTKTQIDFSSERGPLHLILDASAAPEMAGWLDHDMGPFVARWYPRIIAMLPGSGFQAMDTIEIKLVPRIPGRTMNGHPIAGTGGRDWLSGKIDISVEYLNGTHMQQARHLLVHELTHVVQHYGQWYNGNEIPNWLVEGIADYIAYYVYEPESEQVKITSKNMAQARYDAGYAVTANFLNWVANKYDNKIVVKMNSALRDAAYSKWSWEKITGKTLESLSGEWMEDNKKSHTIESLYPRAKAGDASAQADMGTMYRDGTGVAQNAKTAEAWFRLAAVQSHPEAEWSLAAIYDEGAKGIPKNPAEALKWFRRSADHGNVSGATNAAAYYLYGTGGLAKDYALARKYAEIGANGGDNWGQIFYAQLFRDGLGVPKDYPQAKKWYELGGQHGNPVAKHALAEMNEKGWGMPQDLSTALKLYREAADKHWSESAKRLAEMYEQGIGVSIDREKAAEFRKKAEEDDTDAARQRINSGHW